MAVLKVIQKETRPVEIRSDSKYSLDGCLLHLPKWKKNDWRNSRGLIRNADLWKSMDRLLCERGSTVRFRKVKGHASIRDVETGLVTEQDRRGNAAADALAVAGASMHTGSVQTQHNLENMLLVRDVQLMMVGILSERNQRCKLDKSAQREVISISSASNETSGSSSGSRSRSSSSNVQGTHAHHDSTDSDIDGSSSTSSDTDNSGSKSSRSSRLKSVQADVSRRSQNLRGSSRSRGRAAPAAAE